VSGADAVGFVGGAIVPGRPHPLLCPGAHEGYAALRGGFAAVREDIERSGAELIVIYSTTWPSILGHQMQADPAPVWTHVDEEWHELGEIPYAFRIDPAFAEAYRDAGRARGLHCRTVAYHGFPIDTGSVVALKLLNPDNRLPAAVVSCNMYADRAETLVLGKAAADAARDHGVKAYAVAVTALSNRMFTTRVPLADDTISSLKDDEWNRKLLEFLAAGRLEDVSQLMRTFTREANADNKGKALWWLAAAMGQHNRYTGTVHAYAPIYGTGAAVVQLSPTAHAAADLEFDEDDVEVYGGDRGVLSDSVIVAGEGGPARKPHPAEGDPSVGVVRTAAAPKPVGPYPHARAVGDLLFVSGMGPRQPDTDEIPGGPVRDADGPRDYDIAAQTRATIENIGVVLEAAGASLRDVVDVTVFLIDMERDFKAFNEVYREYFERIGPTRTTLEVRALPTPIGVELKVVARPEPSC